MAPGAAEGEEPAALEIEHLAPHEMDHIFPDHLHLTPVPHLHRKLGQQVVIFMVAVHKQQRKILLSQPVHPILLLPGPVPVTEIAAHDHKILPVHFLLLPKRGAAQFPVIPVAIPCDKYHLVPPAQSLKRQNALFTL